ncbi:AAA family ATPase [Bacillus horti]|uniref:Kinase n=1 Tax=Caldalkalibacillus horti TaxID=77523 RepID=A0ABT9W247_9BACI|nr:AAA family ATPase [Bacillus horti]MDQ0167322.1 putative kinase [Bacillus horti]
MFFLQMSGFPGSGKSTLSREIAKRTGALIIDHDITKSAMIKSLGSMKLDSKDLGKVSYEVDWAYIEFYLSQGYDVILDSPCLYSEMIEKGLYLSRKYQARYKYVECYLNDYSEISYRLRNRSRMASQISEAHKESFNHFIDASKRPSDHKYLIVDTSNPLEVYFDEVICYLDEV